MAKQWVRDGWATDPGHVRLESSQCLLSVAVQADCFTLHLLLSVRGQLQGGQHSDPVTTCDSVNMSPYHTTRWEPSHPVNHPTTDTRDSAQCCSPLEKFPFHRVGCRPSVPSPSGIDFLHPPPCRQHTDRPVPAWSCCDQSVLRPQCWVISSVKPSLKSVQTVSWASEDKYFCKNVPVGSHFYAVKSWLIGYIRRLVKTSCDCICFKSEEWKNSENGRAKPGDWGSRQISGRKKGCQFLDLLSKKNKKKHLFCCVNVYQWKSLQTLNVCHFSGNRDMRGSSGYHQ